MRLVSVLTYTFFVSNTFNLFVSTLGYAADLSGVNSSKVQSVAIAEATRLPTPSKPLSNFAQFELAPVTLTNEIRNDNGKLERSRELESKLRAKLVPLLKKRTEASGNDTRGILVIRPHLQKLRIISGGANFFAGQFLGSSFVDLELQLVDAISGAVLSEVLIQRSTLQDTEISLTNSDNEAVIDYVVAIAYQYIARNIDADRVAAIAPSATRIDSMQTLFAGKISSGKTRKGNQYHVFHAPDGTMQGITLTLYNEYHDTGTWLVDESGHYCVEWKKWEDGKQKCYAITEIGVSRYEAANVYGGDVWSFELQSGDPRKLGIRTTYQQNALQNTTGKYQSQVTVTGKPQNTFRNDAQKSFTSLVQNGPRITGSFGDSGEIWGEVVGDTIKFDWASGAGGSSGTGEWKASPDGKNFQGTWQTSTRNSSGIWNLTKIE